MRKAYIKTSLLLFMACLSLLTAGFISSGNVMASQHPHPHRVRAHVHKPHIILKMLPNTGQYYNHQYVARAIIYGVGFENCSSCGSDQGNASPCDTGCTPPPTDTPPPCDTGCTPPPPTTPSDTPSPCDAGCTTSHQEVTDRVTTTDVQTAITTTTTTNVTHHSVGCPTGCTPLPPNTVPCDPCSSNNYNNSRNNNYNNSRNNNYNTTPAPNATCPSYNDCGAGANDSNAGPSDSGSGCDCGNTANLQGNVPFTAPGINLSKIPVNTFGEFRIGVNIRMTPRQARTRPSFWATNSYNRQRSNSTSAPCCSSAFCCQ